MLTMLRSVRKTSEARLAKRMRRTIAIAKPRLAPLKRPANRKVLRELHSMGANLRRLPRLLDAGGDREDGFHREVPSAQFRDQMARAHYQQPGAHAQYFRHLRRDQEDGSAGIG